MPLWPIDDFQATHVCPESTTSLVRSTRQVAPLHSGLTCGFPLKRRETALHANIEVCHDSCMPVRFCLMEEKKLRLAGGIAEQEELEQRKIDEKSRKEGEGRRLRLAYIAGLEMASRARREAHILSNLAHPNIISFIDAFQKDGKQFMLIGTGDKRNSSPYKKSKNREKKTV